MRHVRSIVDAWTKEWKRYTPGARGFSLGSDSFYEVHQSLLEAKDYRGLGLLHEAIGSSAVLVAQSQPELSLDGLLIAISDWIKAAHWYRLGRDAQRSALAGQRAGLELAALVKGEELVTKRSRNAHDVWYVLEMIGDATLCYDPEGARRWFETARQGFASLGRTVQMAEWGENFPGQYHSYTARFIPLPEGKVRYYLDQGTSRIDYKLQYWFELSDRVEPRAPRTSIICDPDSLPGR